MLMLPSLAVEVGWTWEIDEDEGGREAALGHVPTSSAAEDVHILDFEDFFKSPPFPLSLAMKQDQLETCPALSLPNELVSDIFVRFLPVYPKLPPPIGLLSPYLLCHICRRWRNIALTTPRFGEESHCHCARSDDFRRNFIS
ncbi:hypothetical protein B0H19DRAFT_1197750 [Mycena capillaripes]|nr:hypothetical protein B0H19DRAFT_1197750 [Mycena capillaripes]